MVRTFFFALLLAVAQTPSAQSPGFWHQRPSMKVARQEVAAAVLNGLLYVSGGLNTKRGVEKSVEVYDPKTKKWSSIADMPTTLHHHAMTAVGGKLYVIGGYVSSFVGTNRCYSWDPKTNKWARIADLPRPRGALIAKSIGGKVYAVGGVVPRVGVVGELTVYDPTTNKWATLASMPTVREHTAGAALDGKLYVAGGRNRSGNNAVLEAYDPKTNKWAKLTPMPTKRGGNGAGTLGGRLIVVGGEIPGVFKQTEEYDPKTNTWRKLEGMFQAVHGIYPVLVGDEMIVAGGGKIAGYGAVATVQALKLLPDGVARYGKGSPSCNGTIRSWLSHRPQAGESQMRTLCSEAPPSSAGLLALGEGQDLNGSSILGFITHLDLQKTILLIPFKTDAKGNGSIATPVPTGIKGLRGYLQFVTSNTSSCGGAGTTSSSDALDVTFQ